MTSIASGYVRTSNIYYTEGGVATEDTYASNIAYANQVSIYQDSLFSDANAILADNSQNGTFENHIQTMGEASTFGAGIHARSDKQFDYHRSFATGIQADDKTALSYTLQSGITHADYFTDKGSVQEGLSVMNTTYVDSAQIYPHVLFGSGRADLNDDVDFGALVDVILVDSKGGDFGTGFVSVARDRLNYEKNFAAGAMTNDMVDLSYTFGSGVAYAGYYNPKTLINEGIITDNSMYKGRIKDTADDVRSSGRGVVTRDAPSMFKHNIQMSYNGRSSEIDAELNTSIGKYGSEMPVIYTWNTLVDSDGDHAVDMVTAKAYNGNRNIAMQITGKADGLTDKLAGPLYLSPVGFIGISKELYMSYEITR